MTAESAPFDTVVPTLLAGVDATGKDFAVVWTRPEAMLPSFARLAAAEDVERDALVGDVDRFVDLLRRGVADVPCVVVPTWTVAPWLAGGGLTAGRPGGVAWALNARQPAPDGRGERAAATCSSSTPPGGSASPTPTARSCGSSARSPSPSASSSSPPTTSGRPSARCGGGARKLLVLDLDNTLWGGVVGDDGWESLRLGGHDSVGEAYVEFQRALRSS